MIMPPNLISSFTFNNSYLIKFKEGERQLSMIKLENMETRKVGNRSLNLRL